MIAKAKSYSEVITAHSMIKVKHKRNTYPLG